MMQSATVISALTRTSSVRITSRISMCSNCLDTASCGLAHACQNLGIATIARPAEARRGDGDLHRPTKAKVSYYWFATARLAARLAVKLQPVDDLVDHL